MNTINTTDATKTLERIAGRLREMAPPSADAEVRYRRRHTGDAARIMFRCGHGSGVTVPKHLIGNPIEDEEFWAQEFKRIAERLRPMSDEDAIMAFVKELKSLDTHAHCA